MPAEVRDNLTPPLREGALYKYDLGSWPDPPQQLNFVMRVRADGQDYYVRQGVRQEDASPLVGRQMAETVRILLGVSAVTVAALFLFTRLLIQESLPSGQGPGGLGRRTGRATPERDAAGLLLSGIEQAGRIDPEKPCGRASKPGA